MPRHLAQDVAALLRTHRRRIGTRRGRRVLGCFAQAVLALRWFRDGTRIASRARDAGVAVATAYRYLHEVVTVLADQAPSLGDVITAALQAGYEHLLLDGTLIAADRVHDPARASDRWYSGEASPPRRQRPSGLCSEWPAVVDVTGRTGMHRPFRFVGSGRVSLGEAACSVSLRALLPELSPRGRLGHGNKAVLGLTPRRC